MDKALERELIQKGRDFLKSRDTEELEEQGREDYQTDQELKKPQPPLVKAPMGGAVTQLPRDFKPLALQGDFLAVVPGIHPGEDQPAAAVLPAVGDPGDQGDPGEVLRHPAHRALRRGAASL